MIELRRPPGQFARVGHRGASALAPENTLPALELAVELDLKRRGTEEEVVSALKRHGVRERSWISGLDARSLRRVAELDSELPRSYTLPRDRIGASKRGPLAPVVRGSLVGLEASLPRRLAALLRRARATAATLHYSVASAAAIRRAHAVEAAVYVWTVNGPELVKRLVAAAADGIITNDPRIFSTLTT